MFRSDDSQFCGGEKINEVVVRRRRNLAAAEIYFAVRWRIFSDFLWEFFDFALKVERD
jgi:hypothetical protein